VEDSDLYSQPWTAELSFHDIGGQLYEYACHEGNYSMSGSPEFTGAVFGGGGGS
jgi:hypothetical protein